MRAPRIVSVVAALVLTAQAALFAQQEPPVAPGDRVRVTAPTVGRDPLVGTLDELRADTCVLWIEGGAEPLALPLGSVTSLEVSRGRKSNTLAGAGIGLLIGGVGGTTLGLVVGLQCEGDCPSPPGLLPAAIFGGIGAGFGLLIGTAIGAASGTERWEVVDLQSVRVGLTPHGRRGLAVSVSVTF
jgi:hypothetical protein